MPTLTRKYWLTVWSLNTWREFLRAGATIYGLPASYQKRVESIQLGDYLICYMKGSGKSEFFALLEITSTPYWDNCQIWSEEIYPVRLNVRLLVKPDQPIKFKQLFERLTLFRRLKNPSNPKCWGNHFHQSLRQWPQEDALLVIESLQAVKEAA